MPLPVEVLVVPSLHVVVLAVAAAGAAAGAAVVLGAFCTPPWPLQVPLPVELLVVPSLHVVAGAAAPGAAAPGASAARLGRACAKTARDNAINPARFVFFTITPPQVKPIAIVILLNK